MCIVTSASNSINGLRFQNNRTHYNIVGQKPGFKEAPANVDALSALAL